MLEKGHFVLKFQREGYYKRRKIGHRNEESSAPSNVGTVTSLGRQCAEKGLPTYGRRKVRPCRRQRHVHHASARLLQQQPSCS